MWYPKQIHPRELAGNGAKMSARESSPPDVAVPSARSADMSATGINNKKLARCKLPRAGY